MFAFKCSEKNSIPTNHMPMHGAAEWSRIAAWSCFANDFKPTFRRKRNWPDWRLPAGFLVSWEHDCIYEFSEFNDFSNYHVVTGYTSHIINTGNLYIAIQA
jgi:hypothetical protein